jgi:glycine cleavage system H protein
MALAVPTDLKYSKEHEWARVTSATVVVGITAFAVDQLGDVVFLELPAEGALLKKGEQFGVVESTKAVSELYAPLSGKVTKVNKALVDTPEGVNEEPYGKGWMIEVEPADAKELDELLDAGAYQKLIGQ